MDMAPLSAGVLLAMWTLMMVAMMLPGAAPAILRQRGGARRLGFTAGYLIVWIAFGGAAAVLQWMLQSSMLLSEAMALHSAPAAGALVVAIGLYQLSPWKRQCLARCRAPAVEDQWPGTLQGLRYGAACLGCCWALMGLLFVAGVMSYAWIVAIALWVIAEKLLPWGAQLARAAAVGLIAWGGVILAGAL
jgi:predicted metal-binding membrane protein